MTFQKVLVRFAFSMVASFMLVTGLAQTNGANPLVGTWQTSIDLGQGMPPATGIFQVGADGQYREELYIQGQLAAYWQGQYTLAPDGTLTQQESSKSPQICMGQQCVANDGPSTTTSRVSVQGANAFTASLNDPASGQVITVNWQRMGQQPNPTPVGPAPVTPNPAGGVNPVGTAPANPLSTTTPVGSAPNPATTQVPIVGTWQYQERGQAGVVTILLNYTADGRFQVQRFLNGQQFIASYGGTYTFDNGFLVETTTEKSPQFCYRYCEPNPAQLGTSGPMQVSFPNVNTLVYAGINFQRAGQGGMPAGQMGGALPSMPATGMPAPGVSAPGMVNPGMSAPDMAMPGMTGGSTDHMDMTPFIEEGIWGRSPYVDPNSGETFLLPHTPDPDFTYTSPGGNDLRYDDTLDTWYEVDPYGFETEVEEGSW